MIYGGTFLLSILSFFTTFFGLKILLAFPLALIGSLGLQIAMLGIAWNLMKIRENRFAYVSVFLTAAVFSVFFSYANFDSSLKANTRMHKARREYASAVRPILTEYSSLAKEAALQGQYQFDRLEKLIRLEQEKGWTTIVDEGSKDQFIQSVIDGARLMVKSWKTHSGREYHQGMGRGIIVDYLESSRNRARINLDRIDEYTSLLDSVLLEYSGDLPVEDQFDLANTARVKFPVGVLAAITSGSCHLPLPSDQADFVEKPVSRHQAFMLVMNDLFEMDYLAAFSLLLAVAIDLIVILMALAGSFIPDDEDHLFNHVRRDAAARVNRLPLENTDEFTEALQDNLRRFEKASQYGLDIMRVLEDYKNEKKKFRITLNQASEENTGRDKPVRLTLWSKKSKNNEETEDKNIIVI
jgi:hypothetical protein